MRYTKTALLAFGFGLLLGLVVIAAEIKSLERVASALMALGIAGIPIGMVADWRRAVRAAAASPKRGGSKIVARRVSHARRPRKSAVPKR
jgi:xanthosine utilization system XapX-like protein